MGLFLGDVVIITDVKHDALCVCMFLAIKPQLADTEYVITVLCTSVSNPQSLV